MVWNTQQNSKDYAQIDLPFLDVNRFLRIYKANKWASLAIDP
jgi:hypothetical protein